MYKHNSFPELPTNNYKYPKHLVSYYFSIFRALFVYIHTYIYSLIVIALHNKNILLQEILKQMIIMQKQLESLQKEVVSVKKEVVSLKKEMKKQQQQPQQQQQQPNNKKEQPRGRKEVKSRPTSSHRSRSPLRSKSGEKSHQKDDKSGPSHHKKGYGGKPNKRGGGSGGSGLSY